LDDIAVSLGGYVAEEMIFGDITTGPTNDIAVASALARDMVTKYGMSATLGPISFDGEPMLTNWGPMVGENQYSESVAANVDKEVAQIIKGGYDRAREVLTEHRSALDSIAAELKRVETLERKAFEDLLIVNGIKPKRKEEGVV